MTQDALVAFAVIVGLLLLGWVLWPRRSPSFDLRALDRISRSVLAGLVAIWGIGLIVAAFIWHVPKKNELVEHREHLLSFYVLHQSNRPWFPGRSKTWYDVVWYTSEGGRYFSDSLYEDATRDALQRRGAVLQFYINPSQRAHTLENGEHALPTYGLFVDGREIQSLDAALGLERGWVRFGFPILGLGLIALAYYGISRRRTSPNQSLEPTAGRSDGAQI